MPTLRKSKTKLKRSELTKWQKIYGKHMSAALKKAKREYSKIKKTNKRTQKGK